MKLCTPKQMQNIDRWAIEGMGIAGLTLMENAGARVAEVIVEYFGDPAGSVSAIEMDEMMSSTSVQFLVLLVI